MGNSVIDYCIGSCSILQYVESLSIGSKPFSDHMPICLKLKIPTNSINILSNATLSKLHWNEKFASQYKQNLALNPIRTGSEKSSDILINSLTNKIKDSYKSSPNKSVFEPKQKWYNWKCFRLKTSMLKKLSIFRKSHSSTNRDRYISARHTYLDHCNKQKLKFYNDNLSKLDSVRCSKQWWKIAKSLKKEILKPHISLDANAFCIHFSSLLNRSFSNPIKWCLPCTLDPFLDSPFEFIELSSVINSLKPNKSPGPDGIPYEFYKFSCHSFLKEMLDIFNFIFLREEIPASFRQSSMIPLF